MNLRGTQRNAFTLIELLVVVAIIALLISILLPSLGAAREAARAVVCGTTLRGFGGGLNTYAMENRDGIPGTTTSGLRLESRLPPGQGGIEESKMPCQAHDWMTPILSPGMEMPGNRAEKFKFLFDKFRCPSQSYTAIPYGTQPGFATMTATSYLMPMYFQWLGQADGVGRVLGYYDRANLVPMYAKPGRHYPPAAFEVRMDHYTPRIDKVGTAARKIFAADGTRFVDPTTGLLDYDAVPLPNYFGCFATAGAWWSSDKSYGPAPNSKNWSNLTVPGVPGGSGQNIGVSYRHGARGPAADVHSNKGTINAVFFDGHVDRLNDRQSREIHLWYPKGGVVTAPTEGMTEVPADFVIP